MKFKKVLALLLALMLVVTVFAGCANNSGDTTTDTNNTTDTKYDTAHTAEISVVKVSSSSAPSESAWVVAIVLTQEVTKVSNTVE